MEDDVADEAEVDEAGVAPDGSPVAVYRALPVEPEFTPVLEALSPPGSVLDLGCGVGRLANVLAARGFDVTGVDESAEMLAHLDPGVTGVRAPVEGLDLGRRFEVVVLASHFVNIADVAQRRAVLEAAAHHVAPGGQVFVEHWDAARDDVLDDRDGTVGEVRTVFRVLARRDDDFDGEVTYHLGDQQWAQPFTATLLDDDALAATLGEVGLAVQRRLAPTWLVAGLDSARVLHGVLGDTSAFFARQVERMAALGVDVGPYQVSHVAFRTESEAAYYRAREQIESVSVANVENSWHGRPISKLLLDQPLTLGPDHSVSLIELIPPPHRSSYALGLEHVGFVLGDAFDDFAEQHRDRITEQQDQGVFNQPLLFSFDDRTSVKFHRRSLRAVVVMEGHDFDGFHHAGP